MKLQWEREQVMGREMRSISEASSKYKQEVGQKFLDLEKKIITQINSELEGRIIVAINKNMAAFTTRMQEKEKEIEAVSEGIT